MAISETSLMTQNQHYNAINNFTQISES